VRVNAFTFAGVGKWKHFKRRSASVILQRREKEQSESILFVQLRNGGGQL